MLFRSVALMAVVFIGIVGAVLLILEPKARFQRANELRILLFYRSPRFYGLMLTTSSALMLVFVFVMLPPKPVAARAIASVPKIVRAPLPTPSVEPKPVKAPPTFPELRVDGIVLSGEKSFALINSKTVQMGEMIEGLRLVRGEEDAITMELEGQQRVYPRSSLVPPKPSKP